MKAINPAPLLLGVYLAELPLLRVNQIEPSHAFSLKDMQLPLGLSYSRNCKFYYEGA